MSSNVNSSTANNVVCVVPIGTEEKIDGKFTVSNHSPAEVRVVYDRAMDSVILFYKTHFGDDKGASHSQPLYNGSIVSFEIKTADSGGVSIIPKGRPVEGKASDH